MDEKQIATLRSRRRNRSCQRSRCARYLTAKSPFNPIQKQLIVGRDWGHREHCDGETYRALNPPMTVKWMACSVGCECSMTR